MIKYSTYNKMGLLNLVGAPDYLKAENIPISIHRAMAQCSNPLAEDEDILLITAHKDGTLVGYLGLFPDRHAHIKITWLSCIWVEKNSRGFGIARNLVDLAFDVTNKCVFASDYVPSLYKLYSQINYFNPKPIIKNGYRFYIKSSLAQLLPPKHKIFRKLLPILKVTDLFVNSLLWNKRVKKTKLRFVAIDNIDQKIFEALLKNCSFNKNSQQLNWILNNPWVKSTKFADEQENKYYFTSFADKFEYRAYKILSSENQLIGLLTFSVRDGHLKIPFLKLKNSYSELANFVLLFIKDNKIKYFTCFNSELNKFLKKKVRINKRVKRYIMVSNNLAQKIKSEDLNWQDGDGDAFFT